MPDRRQVCESRVLMFATEVGSSSREGVTYTVSGTVSVGDVRCSCSGFKFRGKCRHTGIMEERCGWIEGLSEPQDDDGVCPRCGSRTVVYIVSDEKPDVDDEAKVVKKSGIGERGWGL